MAILVLAANTAYSDFPGLPYFLARDSFMPRQYTYRGDRLAYSTGIVTLGLMAILVLAVFGGETEALIPLYALGVFLSFTLSQSGMCVRWLRKTEPGWHMGLADERGRCGQRLASSPSSRLSPSSATGLDRLHRDPAVGAADAQHSQALSEDQSKSWKSRLRSTIAISTIPVIVPISKLNRVARQTLAYARSISDNVTAVHVSDEPKELDEFQRQWEAIGTDIPLILIESPYRSLLGPLMSYLDEVEKQRPGDTITVVLPEFVAHHLWQHVLHNQTALRLKAALLFRPGTVVTSVPYHLESDIEPVEQ